jgi:spore photoproduct lyase
MEHLIKKLIIDREALDDPLVSRIRERLPGAGTTISDDVRSELPCKPAPPESLVLMRQRGAFVKDFPSTDGSPPCSEKYIITMLNCPYGCTYCYLQSYLAHDRLVLFTDTDRMKDEVARTIAREAPHRITTGEMGDSLALDELTGTTFELMPLFAGTETLLDVRTKSARVDHLLERLARRGHAPSSNSDVPPGNRTGAAPEQGLAGSDNLVVTWTLGPRQMVEREEPGTAPLAERLGAMSRTIRAGVKVGVRFDPIVPVYADLAAYEELVGEIKRAADGAAIHRFELGVLRFPPGLIEKLRIRYPTSPLLRGEYVRATEGKLRLYRPARVALYREIARLIRTSFPDALIELSMESRSVWYDAGIDRSFSC